MTTPSKPATPPPAAPAPAPQPATPRGPQPWWHSPWTYIGLLVLTGVQLLIWSLGVLWGAAINVALLGAGAVAVGSSKRGGKFGTWLRNLFRRGRGSGSGLGLGGGGSGSKWRFPKLFGSSKGGGLGGSSSPTGKNSKSWWPFGKKTGPGGSGGGNGGGSGGSTGGKTDSWWKRKFGKHNNSGGGSSNGGSSPTSNKPGSTSNSSGTDGLMSGLKGLLDCPKCGHRTRDPKCTCTSWSCLCNTPAPATTPDPKNPKEPEDEVSDRKPIVKEVPLAKDPDRRPAAPVVNNSTGPTITPQPPSGAPKAPEPHDPGNQNTEDQQQRNADMTSSVNPRCVVCDHPKNSPAPNCQCTRTQCMCTQLRNKLADANAPAQPAGAGRGGRAQRHAAATSQAGRDAGGGLDGLKFADDQSLQRAGRNMHQLAPAAREVQKRFAAAEELEEQARLARKRAEEGAEIYNEHMKKATDQWLTDMPKSGRLQAEAESVRVTAKNAQDSDSWSKVANNAAVLPGIYFNEFDTDEGRLNGERGTRPQEARGDVITASGDN